MSKIWPKNIFLVFWASSQEEVFCVSVFLQRSKHCIYTPFLEWVLNTYICISWQIFTKNFCPLLIENQIIMKTKNCFVPSLLRKVPWYKHRQTWQRWYCLRYSWNLGTVQFLAQHGTLHITKHCPGLEDNLGECSLPNCHQMLRPPLACLNLLGQTLSPFSRLGQKSGIADVSYVLFHYHIHYISQSKLINRIDTWIELISYYCNRFGQGMRYNIYLYWYPQPRCSGDISKRLLILLEIDVISHPLSKSVTIIGY